MPLNIKREEMKPYIHAQSSAKKFGGNPDDYLPIHQWFDDTKAHFPDNRHRAIKHHSQGIFECERLFGVVITNSDGRQVSVRDIGEQHVLEDLGWIPTMSDYLYHLSIQNWMSDNKPKINPYPSNLDYNIGNLQVDYTHIVSD